MGMSRKRRRELWLGAIALVLVAADRLRPAPARAAHAVESRDGRWFGRRVHWPASASAAFRPAYHLRERSDYQTVLGLYKRVELAGDGALRAAATYNSGNVYFREGLAMHDADNDQQAVPLLELAKGSYRQVLRDDPANWDARYNLERVLRQRPDPEDLDSGGLDAPQQAERAVTTMRGFSLGLP